MGLWQDVRFAARLLIKDKWFTLVAATALALGIGVNNTVFTLVNAVLIRGLPFNEADKIMAVSTRDRVRNNDRGMSYLDFKDWSAASRSFAGLAAYTGNTFNVSDESRPPERFGGSFISANLFKLIGLQPILGRDFLPEDDRPGALPVIILGHGVWKSRYASDRSILGRPIKVNELSSVVIGVMPEGFKFPNNADLWQPVAVIRDLETQKRNARNFEVLARLANGSTPSTAQAELAAIAARTARDYPDSNKDIEPKVQSFLQRVNGPQNKMMFLSLLGAVAFGLLMACDNVANLLLTLFDD